MRIERVKYSPVDALTPEAFFAGSRYLYKIKKPMPGNPRLRSAGPVFKSGRDFNGTTPPTEPPLPFDGQTVPWSRCARAANRWRFVGSSFGRSVRDAYFTTFGR